ncbi:uncharacterized protein LOC121968068 isoform X2 [Zingiber officinale]|uniref:uncharacterized protein LOC121968068 isoform X2 n=1 Tax=Zingiber officinale TaxID=94328 RepID=UPI001C4BD14E|nr:uncharacterized protein LOC121968068 isoform X2 [Zingiber officinale]
MVMHQRSCSSLPATASSSVGRMPSPRVTKLLTTIIIIIIITAITVLITFLVSDDAEVVLSLPRKFLSIFNEILEAAYTPAFHQLIGSKRRAVTEKNIHEKILLVERQQRHLTCNKRHLVISSEFSCLSNLEWSGLQSDLVGEVGVEIGAALLEDIKEETILDMIAQEVYCLSHVKVVAAGTASRVEGPQQLPKKLFIF